MAWAIGVINAMDLSYVRYARVLMLNRNVSDNSISLKVELTSLKVEVTSPSPINRIVSIMASDNQPRRLPLKTMTLTNTVRIGAIRVREEEDHSIVTVTGLNSGAVPRVILKVTQSAVPSQTCHQSKRWIGLKTIMTILNKLKS